MAGLGALELDPGCVLSGLDYFVVGLGCVTINLGAIVMDPGCDTSGINHTMTFVVGHG